MGQAQSTAGVQTPDWVGNEATEIKYEKSAYDLLKSLSFAEDDQVLRVYLMKKYKLENFELSQQYLFFWDKLEKANFFLEQIIDTSEEPLDSRIVDELLKIPVNDGGQWDMIINLVERYGVVPQKLYVGKFYDQLH
ncbi:hypothetical protein TWF106_001729 [Orbilia oligospora]|uniref:Bleomycin hydrolase n=1 Tax=Orbilia oligospora TaxID=2813651 RepID=A0A7C8QTN4_ORBOL|nr:hypothetical protein TWF106_001729 [Orbilia oligospora]